MHENNDTGARAASETRRSREARIESRLNALQNFRATLMTAGFGLLATLGLLGCPNVTRAQLPVLKHSDVVFMYQASRQVYEDYGATVLAWGGRPTEKSLQDAEGLKFFGSVGMVTEFSRYYERFPDSYAQGLCRDLDGKPFKVPWLTDHQHKGIPFWWCCTRQPLFRQYIEERVADTVKAGAHGVHIDDHLGTAGGLFAGGCFCGRCVLEFRDYLTALPRAEWDKLGVQDAANFNVHEVLRTWRDEQPGRRIEQHPLYRHFRIYQFRGAAKFMAELRALAARTAGHPVPMGANACLTWGPHLNDFQSLDLFSAEIPHHAEVRRFNDEPLFAYRLADAVGRPLASTASGHDWAFIKEQNLAGLVQGWIALGYAAGHSLMAPHRQWCYTPEKGTHWYEGPKDKFAPLYRFVRQHATLFDDFQHHTDVTVAYAQRTYDRDSRRIIAPCNQLAAANISYRLAPGGDEIVDHPLPVGELRQATRLLVIEPQDFLPADREALATLQIAKRYDSLEQALADVTPAVRVEGESPVRALPRVKPGRAVVHLLNWNYVPAQDKTPSVKPLRVRLNLGALGIEGAWQVRCHAPGQESLTLAIQGDMVTVPELRGWAVLELRAN